MLYLKISDEMRIVPQIVLKRGKHTSVIKKEDVEVYSDVRELLRSLQAQVNQCQELLAERTNTLIQEKEKEVNAHLYELIGYQASELVDLQKSWEENAYEELKALVIREEMKINNFLESLKGDLYAVLADKLSELKNNEELLGYLSQTLTEQLEVEKQLLKVERDVSEEGTRLVIENHEMAVEINTATLISELREGLNENAQTI